MSTKKFWDTLIEHAPANLKGDSGIYKPDEAPMGVIVVNVGKGISGFGDMYVIDMHMTHPDGRNWFVKVPYPRSTDGWRWQCVRRS